MLIDYWWEARGKEPLGRPRCRWVDNTGCGKLASFFLLLGWILERWDGVMWTGLVWLRIGTGGELL
jgi:hypothetical protein